ncbi:MarR family winged helix-turn-helix transcriptional regulator [Companilactobacillus sp. RD055328]|uniref:MarR family winged helix-turn-helix transcriptional regulator n=1 Tax=Companilactobacillus sp. RD055328 TaxID=2916634 RepID=UPI001FC7D749|nr:MarR family transcriptional regulator [Companilactobacillus sp. RD055328]
MSKPTNKYGLGFMQYCMLVSINENEYETPSELANELQVAISSVSRSLKVLHKKSLISRLSSEFNDTRKIKVEITEHGKELLKKVDSEIDKSIDEIF